MKYLLTFAILSTGYIGTLWKFGGVGESVMTKIRASQSAERRAEELMQENHALRAKISGLEYEVSQLESKNQYYAAQMQGKTQARAIASIPQMKSGDLVNFDVYRWSAEKLLAIGEKELHFKNYQKSAQFYNELLRRFPKHEIISDRVLFGAGVASFEGNYYKWSEDYFSKIVENYPRSEFYRGAKLWLALSQYHQGENQKFLKTVEEFRVKYRNTEEWKILSRYYEDISYKIKK